MFLGNNNNIAVNIVLQIQVLLPAIAYQSSISSNAGIKNERECGVQQNSDAAIGTAILHMQRKQGRGARWEERVAHWHKSG